MAKINVEVDSKADRVKVFVDGEEIKRVHEFFVSSSDGPMGFTFEIITEDDNGDVRQRNRITDSQAQLIRRLVKAGANVKTLARRYGVSRDYILKIANNQRKVDRRQAIMDGM